MMRREMEFILLVMSIACVRAEYDILLNFNTHREGRFRADEAQIYDKDGDSIAPTVVNVSGHIIMKTDTMPDPTIPDPSQLQENNYVYLPYISNPASNQLVVLKYTYTHDKVCDEYLGVANVQCKNYVILYLVPVPDNATDMRTIDVKAMAKGSFNLSGSTGPSGTGDIEKQHSISLPATPAGFRIVLHDEGSAFSIKSLTVASYYCKHTQPDSELPIKCTDTRAVLGAPQPIQCTCDEAHSKPNTTRPSITFNCVFSNANLPATPIAYFKREPSDEYTVCSCTPGYIYDARPDNSRYCRALPTTAPLTASSKTTSRQPATVKATTKPPVTTGHSITQLLVTDTVVPTGTSDVSATVSNNKPSTGSTSAVKTIKNFKVTQTTPTTTGSGAVLSASRILVALSALVIIWHG